MKQPKQLVKDMIGHNKIFKSYAEEKAWKDKVRQHREYLDMGSDTHTYSYEEAERDLLNR